jgi:hypothetical protein
MADPHVVSTLRAKRDELDRVIIAYEGALAAARRDFVNVTATLELFEKECAPAVYPSHMSIVRMFKRGEIFILCNAALADVPEGLDTRELVRSVIRAKGRQCASQSDRIPDRANHAEAGKAGARYGRRKAKRC